MPPTVFRDRRGKIIPPAAFENEPSVVDPADAMNKPELDAFNQKTARIKAAALKLRAAKSKP